MAALRAIRMSSPMLPLVSNSEADVERRLRALLGVAAGEIADFLLLAGLVDLEIGELQPVDRRALLVHDRQADVDDVDAGPEGLGRYPGGRETDHRHEWRRQPSYSQRARARTIELPPLRSELDVSLRVTGYIVLRPAAT